MTVGETFTWLRRAGPLARIERQTWQRIAVVCLFGAAILFPIGHRNDADIDAAANALTFAALALGLNIVVGLAGLLDLGYAAFFAIGAYTYGAMASWQMTPDWSSFWEPFQWLGLVARFHETGGDVVHFQVSFWLMMPVAAAVTAFFGVLFGFPTLRLKGDYLAIVTLGFGEIVPIIARNTPSVTNGAMGLNGVAAPQLFGWSFGVDATPYYYVGLALVAFLILTSQRLKFSRIGRAWMAIREDEIAAAAMGVNRTKMKLLAFATGAAFAGATGTLFVAKLQTATPEMFGFPVSVMILVMIVFGGIGSVWGVVLGALILQLLQSWFLEDLSGWLHSFGGLVALGEVSLSMPAHSVLAVIGPNGSGKSTLFNAVTGLVSAQSGRVRFAGQEIGGLAPHLVLDRGIARTFQNIRLFPNLTVLENVLIGMHARLHTGAVEALLRLPGTRREVQEARDKAMEILAVFGNRLMPRVDHVVSSLSYANRRRVEIARALASRPKLLLLDEPTAGMNPAETLELADQIKSLNRLGLSIVLIEHKLDVVVNLANRVIVLDHGEKIAEGSPAEVRQNDEVIRAYLGRSAAVA